MEVVSRDLAKARTRRLCPHRWVFPFSVSFLPSCGSFHVSPFLAAIIVVCMCAFRSLGVSKGFLFRISRSFLSLSGMFKIASYEFDKGFPRSRISFSVVLALSSSLTAGGQEFVWSSFLDIHWLLCFQFSFAYSVQF